MWYALMIINEHTPLKWAIKCTKIWSVADRQTNRSACYCVTCAFWTCKHGLINIKPFVINEQTAQHGRTYTPTHSEPERCGSPGQRGCMRGEKCAIANTNRGNGNIDDKAGWRENVCGVRSIGATTTTLATAIVSSATQKCDLDASGTWNSPNTTHSAVGETKRAKRKNCVQTVQTPNEIRREESKPSKKRK